MEEPTPAVERPGNVTLISIFYWLNSIVFTGIGLIAALTSLTPYITGTITPDQIADESNSLLMLSGLILGSVVLGVVMGIIGQGLWQLKNSARRAAVLVSSLVIVVTLVRFVWGLMNGQYIVPYGVLFHGLILLILNNVVVKTSFDSFHGNDPSHL